MLGQQGACFKAHLEVIHAKVSRVGVGHIDGHQGNVSPFEDVGHAGRYSLFGLELDGQVNPFGHKLFGVLDGNDGVVAVIEHQQFDAGCGCRRSDALSHSHGEGHLGALGRKTEA